MNSIASVAAVICAVSIASSLIGLIVPQGSSKRVINTVIGVFVICCLIIPVKNAVSGLNFDIKLPELKGSLTASGDEAYSKALIKETESKLESALVSYLLSKNIKIKKADIQLNTSDKKGIYIERISIYINKSDISRSAEIISLTENKFEKTPELTVT